VRTTSPLELLCNHLSADRYAALPAPSASDALRLCHYKQPDLLILDLKLPDAAGLDVLREIRASDGVTSRYPALHEEREPVRSPESTTG
jgi:DNA-binding response OmpR family regulator